jgi:hypothetical protein
MGIAPGGHARQAHTVLDDVVDFPVREILRSRRAQVSRLRIQITANLGDARTIRPVANGAACEEMLARLL